MNELISPAFFLGANAPGGFYSLYSDMLPPEQARAIYILKGGPGCGKSTLMQGIRRRAEAEGLQAEQILCSGDPDSLDAVILPRARIAVCDGTAPHVMEARYPGAVERYINLGDCFDPEGLYPIREELFACKKEYQENYRQAYRCLAAAHDLREDARLLLLTPELRRSLRDRGRSLVNRLLPEGSASPGGVTRRFLSTPTHRGPVFLYETAALLCPRICQLEDRWGFSHDLLIEVLTGAVERGLHPIACPDPMAPDHLAHLLLPELGLAFLSSPEPLPEKPFRRLRLDAMADRSLLARSRPRLRFARRVEKAVLAEAQSCLAEARAGHDRLEALYHPHVDFSRVEQLSRRVSDEVFALAAEG